MVDRSVDVSGFVPDGTVQPPRRHHGGCHKHQPEPGYFVHRSPAGYVNLVTNQGTLALGRTGFSQTIWNAAHPQPQVAAA